MNGGLRSIKTALVPIGLDDFGQTALKMAKAIAEEIVLVGVVPVAQGEQVSAGVKAARQVRKRMLSMSGDNIRHKSAVIVSDTPWVDVKGIVNKEKANLLLVEWKDGRSSCDLPIGDVLANFPCNVAIVRGGQTARYDRTLVAVRGGPHAELSLRVGMGLKPAKLDVMHLTTSGTDDDPAFKGLRTILRQIPEVNYRFVTTEDISTTMLEESNAYDLIVLGVTASQAVDISSIGPVAKRILDESRATVMIVKARRPIAENMFDESSGHQAITILVDQWFAEKTYHTEEFANLKQMLALKEKQGTKISLALPALNEEKTVGKVIGTIKHELMEKTPLLDEIVLIDSNSTDRTREIAADLGVPIYIHQEILPELGARAGKGEALWKSLLVTSGDIIAWIDTDIVNIHPRFVYGIIGPLLTNPAVQFVKGFYRRPLRVGRKIQAGGGGRVTELTARPLLNLFYPELSGVIQPLSGEYAGRREALENAVFFSGYGVETGLLIDIFERHGLRAIAQVDLLERIHHNQELEALSKMSFAIIQTVLSKLERRYGSAMIDEVNKSMKLIRFADGGYSLDVEEVVERHRPPMASLPAYREKFAR